MRIIPKHILLWWKTVGSIYYTYKLVYNLNIKFQLYPFSNLPDWFVLLFSLNEENDVKQIKVDEKSTRMLSKLIISSKEEWAIRKRKRNINRNALLKTIAKYSHGK